MCGSGGRGDEKGRHSLDGENLSAEDSVRTAIAGDNFVWRGGEKLVNGRGGKALLDAIAGGFVFECGNGDDVHGFGESVVAARDVVAASRKGCRGGEC